MSNTVSGALIHICFIFSHFSTFISFQFVAKAIFIYIYLLLKGESNAFLVIYTIKELDSHAKQGQIIKKKLWTYDRVFLC